MKTVREIHAHLIVTGLYTQSSAMAKLLSYCAMSTVSLAYAHLIFDQIQNPSIHSWNTMIRGFSQSSKPKEALSLYCKLHRSSLSPDNYTFPFVLTACARIPALFEGLQIHGQALKLGFYPTLYVQNVLISMYSNCCCLNYAQKVFDEMHNRDIVSWNTLITGYSHANMSREVLGLFYKVQAEALEADSVTMVKVVSACTRLQDWATGQAMADYIEERKVRIDVYLGNTLIDMYGRQCLTVEAQRVFDKMLDRNVVSWNALITSYAKAGNLHKARSLFDEMPQQDLISWTAIIVGYSQASQFSEAITLFREMRLKGVKPDNFTIASVLSACGHLGALSIGRWVHACIDECGLRPDIHVGNALIDMYCKCGDTTSGLQVFQGMIEKDLLTWNSIILGLALNGHAREALEFFSKIVESGVRPNGVTFLGVLFACTHKGLIDLGWLHFESMEEVYGVVPDMKHYGCMVDLLSRAGDLDSAYKFVERIPIQPDPVVWRTLLSACAIYGNVSLAEITMEKLLELEPSNSGNYILLSNVYSTAGRWEDAMSIRKLMKDGDVQKAPGCSSIEVDDKVDEPKIEHNI
ncbi:pentatricopeptide repeat-containing protein At2g29760, chloroplastic-like [Amborella trichopoda]|uniref:pentatricopeptide repeat-containing protein At2g29760, chloroplastic-like n=1 Tax=Amborella trichopoda TaxID=13333 RepID=UPI0009BD515D|nr:pentatricopeptide repeat-containing protein At2g29760, chloroplastic-like [Amborella trichopoda]|eukprot:XP_011626050.2 pentatricopeptide repeat-containing protein At2g29760, chloroplastic-like [Amborella trichopoda]